MRFARIETKSGEAIVLATDGSYRGCLLNDPRCPGPLDSVFDAPASTVADFANELSRGNPFDPNDFGYLPPLSKPGKILCVGLNYHDHTKESNYQQPDYPTIFARFSTSIVGHRRDIVRPRVSEALDYEGELAAIIGKTARSVSPATALDHVFGYSIFNDGSVRDYQHRTPQWTVGKNFDRSGSFGPELVTADELPAGGANLHLETRLNGQVLQSANTSDMIFGIATLVAILSEAMTLEPGDLIVSGTPAGVGASRNPKLFMRPGDVCEVEIEGIGILRNSIVQEAAAA